MGSRYTHEEREQAALICAISASTPDLQQSYCEVGRALGLVIRYDVTWPAAVALAMSAWSKCQALRHPDAEAEALIRCGWEGASDGK